MARRKREEGPTDKVLWTEGQDDCHVCYSLLGHYSIPEAFSVQDQGGWENIREILGPTLLANNEIALGLIVDADADAKGRWSTMRSIMTTYGYDSVPEEPHPGRTIIQQEDRTTVGVWIMPDDVLSGMLEDFARSLMPPQDRLYSRAIETVNSIPEEERLFKLSYLTKAVMHTWLAWQKEPGLPMGRAESFSKMINWSSCSIL